MSRSANDNCHRKKARIVTVAVMVIPKALEILMGPPSAGCKHFSCVKNQSHLSGSSSVWLLLGGYRKPSVISKGSLLAACACPRKISKQWWETLQNHTFQDYLLGINTLLDALMELLDPTAVFALSCLTPFLLRGSRHSSLNLILFPYL